MATAKVPSITTTLDALLQGKQIIGQGTGPIRTTKLVSMTPVPQSNQLVIKGLSYGTSLYPLTMNIFGVQYSNTSSPQFPLSVNLPNGNKAYASQVPLQGTRVQVRCPCANFRYCWSYWNNKNKAIAGPAFPPYTRKTTTRPEVNPAHVPGACKHIIALTDRLIQSKILVK